MRLANSVALASLLAACGGSTAAPTTSAVGTLGGQTLPKMYAVAGVQDATGSSFGAIPQLTVALTSDPAFQCDQLYDQGPKAGRAIVLSFSSFGQKTWSAPSEGGVFLIGELDPSTPPSDGNHGLATYEETDATCQVSKATITAGASGTATLTAFSLLKGRPVTGSFDLLFEGGHHVTGVFDTVVCPGGSADAGTCQ